MSAPSNRRACPACGEAGAGNFCARCGGRMPEADAARRCSACGAELDPDGLYCGDCGAPVGRRPSRSMRERLPWILSGLALVAFATAIALAIGESTGERAPGMPPTGGILESPGEETETAEGPGPASRSGSNADPGTLDPAGVDLSSMSGREAADRLFDRAMRTGASGDSARARFFAEMGLRAYETLPSAEMDADASFHVGLLRLVNGDTEGAARSAESILSAAPDHLFGWILRARVAEARGDEAAVADANRQFREALEAELAAERPEYARHRTLIDDRARSAGAAP